MAGVLVQAATMPSLTLSQGGTAYGYPASARLPASAEVSAQRTFQVGGTFSKLWVRIVSNGVSATSTIRSRLNGANGAQSVSINAASTGEFIDASNSDAVVAGDEFVTHYSIGAGGTSLNPSIVSYTFAATTNTYAPMAPGNANLSSPAASTTYYFAIAGGLQALVTTEANVQAKMKAGGTIKHLHVYCSANTRTTDTLYRSRINGANGNLLATVTGSTTGLFEDTSNTDTIAANDLVNLSGTTGTGTGNLTASAQVGVESTDNTITLIASTQSASPLTITTSLTRYFTTTGHITAGTTESEVRGQVNYACTASKLGIYLSANTVSATSTLRLRVNGADVNQAASITASTTGWFDDTTNSDAIADGDEINYSIVTGATGTSLTVDTVVMLLTAPSAGGAVRRSLTLLGVGR